MYIPIVNKNNEELVINTDQIAIIYDKGSEVTFASGITLTLMDESMKLLEETIFPKKREKKSNEPKTELNDLFDKLHKLVGGKGKAIFTPTREKKLNELITKHRMNPVNLVTAATNIGNDAWLQGENESKKRYGDIDYLLRPDKAAKWAEEQEKKKKGMF